MAIINKKINNQKDISKSFKKVLTKDQIGISAVSSIILATNDKAQLPLIDHSHKDKLEIMIVVDGIQKVKLNQINYTLYPSEALIVMPNKAHSSLESPVKTNTILCFQIDLSQDKEFLNQNPEVSKYLYNQFLELKHNGLKLDTKLTQDFLEAFDGLCKLEILEKTKGQQLFIYCLLSLFKQQGVLSELTSDIDYAKQYIILNIKDALSITEIAKKTKLSAKEFKSKFTLQIGMPPKEYIAKLKIEAAMQTISSSKKSIFDIALDFGFSSKKSFCSAFKKQTGLSPLAYRRKYNKNK